MDTQRDCPIGANHMKKLCTVVPKVIGWHYIGAILPVKLQESFARSLSGMSGTGIITEKAISRRYHQIK